MRVFTAQTATEAWSQAARAFLEPSETRAQNSPKGKTLEIPQAAFVITNPLQRWISNRRPPANIALAIAELIWILRGRTDSMFLTRWSKKYGEYTGGQAQLHDAYGHRLRRNFNFDQLTRSAAVLRANPDQRQIVLQIWDSRIDFPTATGPANVNIPCNVLAMIKIRDGSLEWTQIVRSNDFYRGVPFNFFQFTFLQEVLAGWLNLRLGTYTHFADSLHLYDEDGEYLRQSMRVAVESSAEQTNTDLWQLSEAETESVTSILEIACDRLQTAETSKEAESVNAMPLPLPAANFFLILKAERLRQLRTYDSALQASSQCSNPFLREAWLRWNTSLSRS